MRILNNYKYIFLCDIHNGIVESSLWNNGLNYNKWDILENTIELNKSAIDYVFKNEGLEGLKNLDCFSFINKKSFISFEDITTFLSNKKRVKKMIVFTGSKKDYFNCIKHKHKPSVKNIFSFVSFLTEHNLCLRAISSVLNSGWENLLFENIDNLSVKFCNSKNFNIFGNEQILSTVCTYIEIYSVKGFDSFIKNERETSLFRQSLREPFNCEEGNTKHLCDSLLSKNKQHFDFFDSCFIKVSNGYFFGLSVANKNELGLLFFGADKQTALEKFFYFIKDRKVYFNKNVGIGSEVVFKDFSKSKFDFKRLELEVFNNINKIKSFNNFFEINEEGIIWN